MFIKHPWHNGPKDTPPNCVVTGDWQELITINYLPNSYSCTKFPNIHNSNWSFNINYRAFTPSTYFGTYSYCAHMVANHIKMPIYPLLDALQHFGTTIAPKPSWPHVTFQTLIINHMISKLRIHLQSSTLKIEEIEVEGCCSQGSCSNILDPFIQYLLSNFPLTRFAYHLVKYMKDKSMNIIWWCHSHNIVIWIQLYKHRIPWFC